MTIHLHERDLPDDVRFTGAVAVDSETLGLKPGRDRLCLVQLSGGDGVCHLVRFRRDDYAAPNLVRLFADPTVEKLFHYARFDIAVIEAYLGVMCQPIYCTKIASRLTRTYTDKHGLKDLCRELLAVVLDKQQQSSDWGAETLSPEQLRYAASDVLYLHALRERLDAMLAREGRSEFARACFAFLPTRARLDLAGWPDDDIFSH